MLTWFARFPVDEVTIVGGVVMQKQEQSEDQS
jgi:hypothetical protein